MILYQISCHFKIQMHILRLKPPPQIHLGIYGQIISQIIFLIFQNIHKNLTFILSKINKRGKTRLMSLWWVTFIQKYLYSTIKRAFSHFAATLCHESLILFCVVRLMNIKWAIWDHSSIQHLFKTLIMWAVNHVCFGSLSIDMGILTIELFSL